MLKILVVFGTRPEAVKMAPLIKELKEEDAVDCKVCVTAQHRDMLDQVLSLFHIQPDYDLDIMHAGQGLFDITRRALGGLKEVIEKENPGLILVHGDTTTTFTAALSAFYLQVPVAHVEAGLRTGNKFSPFPEEKNRHMTGVLADIHFAPTPGAKKNLLKENVPGDNIFVTGNTVIDALLAVVEKKYTFYDPVLNKLDFNNKKILLVTTHRRENLGTKMRDIYYALREVLDACPEAEIVFPVHKNPVVRKAVDEILGGQERVHLIDPLDYRPFVNLMQRCCAVLTDSGGMQEEAPSLGKPVLVLRDTTERPEAVEAGTVKLVGSRQHDVRQETLRILQDENAYRIMAEAVNPYGDGKACKRIINYIKYWRGKTTSKPSCFIVEK
ncbi:MAG: UDP-N-acetylglucosamine 2-epimerase (non-hydrolyzing) [Clostridiales bacterium]|nr:UDP-N-acetylglucosamine 2-epimerase (non-hydrolyzing) [Clostridiales bacterium]MCF8022548.1 UDP-N-acetylglucosamine 2-epimerase (non-hydrolyzing) [Clostridiales bacterium]